MRTEWKWSLSLMSVGLVFVGEASAARIQVQVPALVDRSAPVTDSVRKECYVGQLIGNQIFQKIREQNSDATQLARPEQAGSDPLLKLTVLEANGEGTPLMGNNKSITVRADLLLNGQVAATKEFTGDNSKVHFAVNVCNTMERIADLLGKDIALWLPGAMQAAAASAASDASVKKDANSTRSQIDKHRRYIPAPTNFAAIDNDAAIPSNEEGRANYRQYLSMSTPKAFVIYSTGRTRAYEGDADVMAKALDVCASEGKACWLYAVDDRVVWSANEGLRTGLSARLKKKINY
jgi:hypothetical protein